MLQVMWLVLTNQIALFLQSIYTIDSWLAVQIFST